MSRQTYKTYKTYLTYQAQQPGLFQDDVPANSISKISA
jgi:hypothetical protein